MTTPPPPPPGQFYYQPFAPRKTNGLAIAALVCSLFFAPLGILFGHISLSQIKRTGDEGRGLAIAGLVIGYIFTVVGVVVTVVVVASVVSFMHAVDDQANAAYDTSSYPTYSTTEDVPSTDYSTPDPSDDTASVIRQAQVGSCIHRVTGATNSDGTSSVTVTPATCGSNYATDRVTKRTNSIYDCDGNWVRTGGSTSDTVLCLEKE
ncbi:DUF4190 domain-containing protein [Skermania sp. ID1734]|uniref:DUF4190 domain-containing protein n=1 Tax=Skermania sp. ID1734 TaxID=2597516 RepID=UPI00117E1807|nr:DUF4190 domain-containing protein [Skermania sp. ID1734]